MGDLPQNPDTDQAIAGLSPQKRKLFELMLAKKRPAKPAEPEPRRPAQGSLPLSFAQRRLWFIDRLGGSPAYHLLLPIRFAGALQRSSLERALNEIVRRHEILRTIFEENNGEPCQVIQPHRPAILPVIDVSLLDAAARAPLLEDRAVAFSELSFQLARGPLLRWALMVLAPGDFVLLLVMHHIVSDGWSNHVLLSELSKLYEEDRQGRRAVLPELKVQYADFAAWQRAWFETESCARQLAYWKRQLAGAPSHLELITDLSRPPRQTFAGGHAPLALGALLARALHTLAQETKSTPFMALVAGFAAMLSRYSGQDEILIGSPIANRTRPWMEPMIGFFVNTLVLRVRLDGCISFADLVRQVRRTTLEAYQNQDIPFESLVEHLRPRRDPSRSPFFQAAFVLHNTDKHDAGMHEAGMRWMVIDPPHAQFELTLALTAYQGGFSGHLNFNAELYEAQTAGRMGRHFANLLMLAATDPSAPLASLSLLTEAERQRLLGDWAGHSLHFPVATSLSARFQRQAVSSPDAVALIFDHGDAGGNGIDTIPRLVSFAALDARANRIARRIVEKGVRSGTPVGLCLERSPELVTGLIAILKVGAAYVPLDPINPDARLAYIAEDTDLPLVLTQASLTSRCQARKAPSLAIDELSAEKASSPTMRTVDAAQVAYIIYTSGSTGRPKGVPVPHDRVCRLFAATEPEFQFGPADVWTLFHSYAFDFSVWELWGALLYGGRLTVLPNGVAQSPQAFLRLLSRQYVTVLNQTPSAFYQLARVALANAGPAPALRWVIFGGESLVPAKLKPWLARFSERPRLVNMYGITETTVHVTHYAIQPGDPAREASPIGRPLADLGVYLLDRRLQPVPPGAAGEIHVAGAGLALGYWRRPAFTAERFIPNPFGYKGGGRLYRSGDMARHDARGDLCYLGRKDGQVKIRGYRIELGEIETAVGRCQGVAEAAIISRDWGAGAMLTAYLVPKANVALDRSSLRTALRHHLPEYMIPSAFVIRDALPMTSNGKVDRAGLARDARANAEAMGQDRVSQNPYDVETSAANPTAQILACLWAEILEVPSVGPRDDFFELGGHSLLATQVISRIREIFGVDLPLSQFFAEPTIEDLARSVAAARSQAEVRRPAPISPMTSGEEPPLSFAQQRLWFLDQLEGESIHHYNIPCVLALDGRLCVAALERSVGEITARHQVLRGRILEEDGQPRQRILDPFPVTIPVVDFAGLSHETPGHEARRMADRDATTAFDLANDNLFRVTLARLAPREWVLIATMHHMVADGWSLGIWMRELALCYDAFVAGDRPSLPPLAIQYADFAFWQRHVLAGEMDRQLRYWRTRLAGAPPHTRLPLDYPRPAERTYRGAVHAFEVEAGLADVLAALGRRHGATPFMVMYAAFTILLHRYTRQDDLVIGTSIANRHRESLEPLIGLFANTLALRCDLGGDPDFSELLRRVRTDILAAHDHQDLPMEHLVEALHLERDPSYSPLFQVMFVMQNAPLDRLNLRGLTLSPWKATHVIAKYDLTLFLQQGKSGLEGVFEYNTDLFKTATIAGMAQAYIRLFQDIAAQPNQRIGAFSTVAPAAHAALAAAFSDELEVI